MAGDVIPQWDSVCTSCRARLEQSGRLIQDQIQWALEFLGEELLFTYWAHFANAGQKMSLKLSLKSRISSMKL